MGNLKNSLKKLKIESKEIDLPGFEDSVTIYPISGNGLIKIKDISEQLENSEKYESSLTESIEKLQADGLSASSISAIDEIQDRLDSVRQRKNEIQNDLISFTLKNGAKADEEDIQEMINGSFFAAMELVKYIIEYSSEYNEAKMKEFNNAKKKLKK